MSATVTIKNSDLLRQVLDRINTLEMRFYYEDMNELNTLLSLTSIHSQRISTINDFVEQKRKELLNIDNWTKCSPQKLASTVMFDLKKVLSSDEENFTLTDEQLHYFTDEKSYPHSIASVSVILKILKNLDTMLVHENLSIAHEPQSFYKIPSPQDHSSQLTWQKDDTSFIELFSALHETGSIGHKSHVLTRKEMFEHLMKTFNLNIKDIESKLTYAKRRKKNKTPFLDSLRSAFLRLSSRNTLQD